jgi:hypothetical protein
MDYDSNNTLADTMVEVIGSQGNTLNIIASDSPRYGELVERENHHSGSISFSDYSRDAIVEREYGEPDFGHWQLFHEAQQQHRKVSLIYAYHVLSGLKGMDLAQAKAQLNTHTLALYDPQAAMAQRAVKMIRKQRVGSSA